MTDIVNYYDELGLDRDTTVEDLHDVLRARRLQYAGKAARSGSNNEQWVRLLELVDSAAVDFVDEDSRDRYDIRLRQAAAPAEDGVDWTQRAWSYFAAGDTSAALIAARKAKEQSPTEVKAYIASAWIHLEVAQQRLAGLAHSWALSTDGDRRRQKEAEYSQAKHDADEAFVLAHGASTSDDEARANTVHAHEVRGVVQYELGQYANAEQSLTRAIADAPAEAKPVLYWRKAHVYRSWDRPAQTYEAALDGLSQGVDMQASTRVSLEDLVQGAITRLDRRENDPEESVRRYVQRRTSVVMSPVDKESKERILRRLDERITQTIKETKAYKQAWAEVVNARETARAMQAKYGDPSSNPPPAGHLPPSPHLALGLLVGSIAVTVITVALTLPPLIAVVCMVIAAGTLVYLLVRNAQRRRWLEAQATYEANRDALRITQQVLAEKERHLHALLHG